ncbi:24-hydroxycholesterol 7-alpha-hydroxylase-like [Lingula anatina]|uniref:24-hydroxycholesterol 7-alpha-hydroxylase-like n=1 Tax=Lingula anatina TaxID=7574 RepID=A0A1S3J5R7_LINAN|nr:24-hydroxycholesterol 7-alpha-hydroxylase-like [Lingula anatina]|eukprot:XP_013405648.2 24-hydroxycholesterol 7-alpha-hydroxylase-like [Lingula anatina]
MSLPVIAAVVTAFSALVLYLWSRRKSSTDPPILKGWVPWLGCAVEFGKAPLWFIQKAKCKLGPLFTIYVTGKRLTFVTEQEDFKHFFQSPNVDFQQAVQQPVKNTASVKEESFFQYHTKIHDTVKGRLAPSKLGLISQQLSKGFLEQLNKSERSGQSIDLNDFIRNVMYAAVLNHLFGKGVMPTDTKEGLRELTVNFVEYDDEFEYGSQLPELFLKQWAKSKHWLLNLFRNIVKKLDTEQRSSGEDETLLQTLIASVDRPHAPNYGLLLMWASLANAIPISFWTVAFILSEEGCLEKAKKEIKEALGSPGSLPSDAEIPEETLLKMPYIKQCIMEAIRLRSPGVITRKVVKPIPIRNYIIPAGDHIMLSPYWAHRNTQFFPDPERFYPERWDKADLEKNVFLEGFVAFGGGRYQCPGRWFALMEIHIFIALLLHKFDMKLVSNVPNLSPLHLVGTQQPVGKCLVDYKMY